MKKSICSQPGCEIQVMQDLSYEVIEKRYCPTCPFSIIEDEFLELHKQIEREELLRKLAPHALTENEALDYISKNNLNHLLEVF